MSSPEAIQKIEQAKALIEEARAAVQGKSDLDAKELEGLKKKLKDKERDLLQKDREIQRKEKDLQAKDRDLKKANEALDRSKQPLKNFIQDEIRKSYAAVAEAKQAHSQSPSKYTAGFIEIAKGSHAENEELLKRLATAVGIDYSSLDLDLEAVEKKQQIEDVRRLVEKEPRKPHHLSRYVDRSTKLMRRDSAVA